MRIQHNILAMNAYRNYTNNVSAMKKNLEKLSSGYKINRAGDDAAGLAISEKMRAQITGLETAQKNAKDGISLVQTAEGALTEVHDMLNRMVELATQSANGTYDNETDRAQMQKELDQLRTEIDRIADSSNFNGIKLLDGTMSSGAPDNTVAFKVSEVDSTARADLTASMVGTLPATNATPPTILHESGASAAMGKFTIALDQLSVGAVSGNNSQVKITFTVATTGGGTKTCNALADGGSTNTALDGKTIANKFATNTNTGTSGKYFAVKANGDITFSHQTSGLGNYSLVYEASDNGDGTITYNLSGYTDSTGNFQAIANQAALENLSASVVAGLKTASEVNLDMTVDASAVTSRGDLTDNRQNRGFIDALNTTLKGDSTFGNTYASFDASKLADGMRITIGAGNQTVTKVVGTDIKISDLDLTDSDDQLVAMNRISAAFATHAGIYVGVNANGDITLSEKTTGSGASSACQEIQDAMGSIGSFATLLKVEGDLLGGKDTQIEIDANAIKDGDTITLNGTDYVFTNNPGTDTADIKYIQIAGAATMASDLASKVGSGITASGAKLTLSSSVSLGDGKGKSLTLQIGDTAASYNQLKVDIKDMHVKSMGAGMKKDDAGNNVEYDATSIQDISIADQDSAKAAVDVIKRAINYVSDVRGSLGATQNRLDHTINNLSVMTENIQDAESTIRDTDVAAEMMEYTKNNILIQSAQAMLAQANQVPQGVLQLLQ